jgi:uncharacterized protein (TIGR02246 family)
MKKNLYSSYEKREEEKESKSDPHSEIKKEEIERNEIANIRVVREALQALNSGDISNVQEFISPQYFNHESQMDPIRSKLRGPEEFIDTVRNLRSAFADLHYEEQEIVASKDKVISILNVTGKHVGNFFVIPPTGNDIRYRAVHIHTIGNDSKIVEHMAIRDDLTFMTQLGVVGPNPEYDKLFQDWKGFTQSHIPQQQASKQSTDNEETEICSHYFQMIDGWNNGDGELFASPFEEDGDLVGFDGTHLKGRQQIASFHQQLLQTYVKGSRLVGKIRDVRFLTPTVAIMHAVGGTVMMGQTDIEPDRNSIHTLVFKKGNGNRWCIAAFQNTRVQYTGRPEMSDELTRELREELQKSDV